MKGRANRNRLDADFGRLGEVSLHFHGKSAPPQEGILEELFGECKGPATRHQVGTLRGHLHFRGEQGFVDVTAHRLRAQTTRTFRRVCEPRGSRHEDRGHSVKNVAAPHPHGNRLSVGDRLAYSLAARARKGEFRLAQFAARAHSHGRQINLLVFQTEPELLSIIFAGDNEQVGRVEVERAAIVFPEHNPLELSEPGTKTETALLKGRQPFRGKAEYVKSPGAQPTWTGSLRISLPGEKALALTGAGFHAGLCISESAKEIEHCSKVIAQGSGSHSQPLADVRLSWSR